MMKNRFIIALTILASLLITAGCDKNDPVSGTAVDGPTFAAQYNGTLTMMRRFPSPPAPWESFTDSVVIQIEDNSSYILFINGSQTKLCNSQGFIRYLTETDEITLQPEKQPYTMCDTIRIPQGIFQSSLTDSSLIMSGLSQVLSNPADTAKWVFRLEVPKTSLK